MAVRADYLDALAEARNASSEPFGMPWPMPGNPSDFKRFVTFGEWRGFVLQFSLNETIPAIVSSKFERAQKLYILAWADADLLQAGELIALTALELAVRDRYAGAERERRRHVIREKAAKENREPRKGEKAWAENLTFAELLKYMVERDGLTDDQLPMNQRCGSFSTIVPMLTGAVEPGLAGIRNDLAHGYPFGGWPRSGLLEVVRDLITFAYRNWAAEFHRGT